MKKLFIVIVATIMLSGCAQVSQDFNNFKAAVTSVITPDNADTIQASYGAALAVAVNYRRLCVNRTINKSCWKVIAAIQPYEQEAYNSIVAMRAFIRANPTADYSAFIQASKNAIRAFKSAQLSNGVK